MAQSYTETLEQVKRKIKAIHKQKQDLEKEVSRLKSELEKGRSQIETLTADIDSKESELESLKLAKAYQSEGESDKEAKARINEMVKEIDRCIALLNN
ncbi:MAG: hypothetical protein HKN79_04885 [Flavobacteriales bacterium]|nr:hypothetical protein [Flavobacteriales bacterium]